MALQQPKRFITDALARTLLAAAASFGVSAGAQTLELWVSSSADAQYYQEMAQSYEASGYPELELNITTYGFTEIADALALAVRTGQNAPDIVQLDENFFGLYLGEETVPFVDLTQRMLEAGLEGAIVPERLELFSYEGRRYGVPQSLAPVVLYYRHDIFEEYGFSEADLETWDDFITVGEQLLAASGAEAMLTLDPSYWEILLRQRGVDLYNAAGELQITSEASIEVLEWLVALKDAGIANDPPRGSIFDPPYLTQVLGGGQVLTVMSPDWFGLDYLKGVVPEMAGEWRATALPRWPGDPLGRRTSSYAGQGLLIYEGSAEVEASWEFVRFVMGEVEPNVQRFLQNNSLTAFRPAWEDERLYAPDPYFDGQVLAELLVSLAEEIPVQFQAPGRAQLLEAWRSRYWPSVSSGQRTPEEALRALAQEAQAW